MIENMVKTIESTLQQKHVFVKYGSSMINERIGEVEECTGIKYIHRHDGGKPKMENKAETYNKNMKIRPCVIYKLEGRKVNWKSLLNSYTNLEIISDKN